MVRNITVVVSSNNSTLTFTSVDVTTLSDLKSLLRDNNIEVSNMSFYEGLSKAEYLDDSCVFPSQQPYTREDGEAVLTDDLIFMVSPSKKNIASGLIDRCTLYATIKDNNLADAVKNVFGKNFTNVNSRDLKSFIDSHVESASAKKEPKDTELPAVAYALTSLLAILVDNGSISLYDATVVLNRLVESFSSDNVTEDPKTLLEGADIDKIFSFVK